MTSKYTVIKPLDKGSFGEVSLVMLSNPVINSTMSCATVNLKKSEGKYVIKKVEKDKVNDTLLSNEIEAGGRLVDHPFIPKFIETYNDQKFCYMVFEYFHGDNLYSFLESRNFKPLREHQIKRIMRQLVDALVYCHSHKICHRDLKLENVLYNPMKRQAKLIDFGLCAVNGISCADMCNNWCGSPDYVCPEILIQQPYSGCLSDVWSLGIILYVLLFGQMPFNFKERYYSLQHGEGHPELEFPSEKEMPQRVSDGAKDLIKKMLAIEPRQRISMEEIPCHKWMQKKSNHLFAIFKSKEKNCVAKHCAEKHTDTQAVAAVPCPQKFDQL